MRALLLTAMALLALGPASAQEDDEEAGFNEYGIRMTAEVVFDGRVQSGQWACVRVEVENIGEPVDGLLQILTEGLDTTADPTRYARHIDVGRKARKRVFLYFEAESYGSEWKVNLFERGGRGAVVAAAGFRTTSREEDDVVVAVVGEDPLGLNTLRETWNGAVPGHARVSQWERRRVQLSLVQPPQMPDRWIGYNVLDLLIWRQPDTTGMSDEQLAAVAHFVGMGGTLVVPVSDHWQQVRDSALAELLPVELRGAVEVESLDPLLASLELPRVDMGGRRALVADARARDEDCQVRAADGDRVLWAVREYGLGRVVFLAADPGFYPIKGEVDRTELWRRLLWLPEPAGGQRDTIQREQHLADALTGTGSYVPPQAYGEGAFTLAADQPISECIHDADTLGTQGTFAFTSGYYYGSSAVDSWFREVRNKLNDIPALKPLPLGWIVLFAAVYLFCIGPLDYFFLRLIGRQEWTWITFPVLITVFFAAAVVGTTAAKGRKAVMTRLEVVDVIEPDGLWRGQSFVGIFASQRTELTLRSAKPHSVVSPTSYVPISAWWMTETLNEGYMRRPAVQVGPGAGAMAYGADTWTMAYLQSAWVDERADRGHFTLREDGEGLISVVNESDVSLYSAMLLYGRQPGEGVHAGLLGVLPGGEHPYHGGWGIHALGPLVAGGSAQVDLAAIEVDAATAWPTPPPSAMTRPHDQEDWNHFREMPEFWGKRGHLDLVRALMDGQLVLVGYSSTPVEDFELDGLDPVSEPRTMVRVLLGRDPRLEGLRAVEAAELPPVPRVHGALSQQQIQQVIGQFTSSIRWCYEQALYTAGPDLQGRVDVKFTIDNYGYVSSVEVVSSTLGNPVAEQCVADQFWSMVFPAPTGGGIVVVNYPLVFKPG